jgi:hypothetical protein
MVEDADAAKLRSRIFFCWTMFSTMVGKRNSGSLGDQIKDGKPR